MILVFGLGCHQIDKNQGQGYAKRVDSTSIQSFECPDSTWERIDGLDDLQSKRPYFSKYVVYRNCITSTSIYIDYANNLRDTLSPVYISSIYFEEGLRSMTILFDKCSKNLDLLRKDFNEIDWRNIDLNSSLYVSYSSKIKECEPSNARGFNFGDTIKHSESKSEAKKYYLKYINYFKFISLK